VYNKATRPPARGRGESEVESSRGLGAALQPMNLTPLIFFYFKMAAKLQSRGSFPAVSTKVVSQKRKSVRDNVQLVLRGRKSLALID